MYLNIAITLVLIFLGYVFGRYAEKKHFKSIIKREEELKDILLFNERTPPEGLKPKGLELVDGNVVVSVDYFKRVASALRGLIGGRVNAYETLIERARREAILRMKANAQRLGANMVINVRLETASISKGNKQKIGSVEVYAYGTALVL